MYLKHPSKTIDPEKPTTTDVLEQIQKLSDEWFIKNLPERPKDKPSKKRAKEEEEESFKRPFV